MAFFDPQKHRRRSIRLKEYDYTHAGAYFITLVTHQRECLFGEVVKGEMCLNAWGSQVENEWRRLGKRFDMLIVDEFAIMPNHVHGILLIREGQCTPDAVGAGQENSVPSVESSLAPPLPNAPRLLQTLLGWQRNYYERIIRDEAELKRIREAILNNPQKWELDLEKTSLIAGSGASQMGDALQPLSAYTTILYNRL